MSERRAKEEILKEFVDAMGDRAGSIFYGLWREFATLNWKWTEFVELFAAKPQRVELMNQSASAFFRLAQDALLESVILHISRLTDPAASKGQDNLSLKQLYHSLPRWLQRELVSLIEAAEAKARIVRDRRHRLLAHLSLDVALGDPAIPIAPVGRRTIDEAIEAIAQVLNHVENALLGRSTAWSHQVTPLGGAIRMLQVLDEGHRCMEARTHRLKTGKYLPDDIGPRPEV